MKSLKCQPCRKCRSRDLVELCQELRFCSPPVGKPCFTCEDSRATDESSVNDAITTPEVPTPLKVSEEHFKWGFLSQRDGLRYEATCFLLSISEPTITKRHQFQLYDLHLNTVKHILSKFFGNLRLVYGLNTFHRLTETDAQVVNPSVSITQSNGELRYSEIRIRIDQKNTSITMQDAPIHSQVHK